MNPIHIYEGDYTPDQLREKIEQAELKGGDKVTVVNADNPARTYILLDDDNQHRLKALYGLGFASFASQASMALRMIVDPLKGTLHTCALTSLRKVA